MKHARELTPTQQRTALAFGSFQFIPAQRTLLRGGTPVRLTSRVREILTVLMERPGEIVDKRELIARVWRGVVVHDSALRVHMVRLRRLLREDCTATSCVENVTGHGYRLVAPVTRLELPDTAESLFQPATLPSPGGISCGLPAPVGCEHVLATIAERLRARRLVTLIGPGGVGKTTLALTAIRQVVPRSFAKVCLLDLAAIKDPLHLPSTLAAALGVDAGSEDPFARMLERLQHRRTLIVLDNCEHLIDAAAHFVERLLALAPTAHTLITSREALRAPDEAVVRIAPLPVPPPLISLSVDHAMTFSSIALFVARMGDQRESFKLTESNVCAVAEICRRLDGLPLAIELASHYCATFGIQTLSAHLEGCLELLNQGQRTAPAHHRSLRALLDWSYEGLSPVEQLALRRLAVFSTSFGIDSARAVLSDEGAIASQDVFEILSALEAKSLLRGGATGDLVQFCMLHTMRCYALEKLVASGDGAALTHLRARPFPVAVSVPSRCKAA